MIVDAHAAAAAQTTDFLVRLGDRAAEMIADPREKVRDLGHRLLTCLHCDAGSARRCDSCGLGFLATQAATRGDR